MAVSGRESVLPNTRMGLGQSLLSGLPVKERTGEMVSSKPFVCAGGTEAQSLGLNASRSPRLHTERGLPAPGLVSSLPVATSACKGRRGALGSQELCHP